MTAEEARRLYMVQQVLEHQIPQRQAAGLLQRSVRQVRRIAQRVRHEGPRGIVHRLRGRRSNRRHAASVQQRVVGLVRRRYRDFGPTLLAEHLQARHRLRVNRETLRQWLLVAGLWQRRRRAQRHHQWRERKACAGELVQVDGSHHDWLEGRGPWLVLMAYIDDATNRVFARFYDYEGTLPALDSFARYARRYGLPQAVYVDRHTTYRSPGKRTLADELAGRTRPQSQFERALGELGVQVIPAYSPQAKGRVERLFGILQDRLVKELRLAGACTRDDANRGLTRYLPGHNRRFTRAPQQATNLHRPPPAAAVLRRVLAIRQRHVLRHDNTVQHATKTYLLAASWNGHRPQAIQAEVRLDGKLYLCAGHRVLRYREVHARPPMAAPRPRLPRGTQRRRTPAPDHPWRRDGWRRRRSAFRSASYGTTQQRTLLSCEEADISKLR